MMIVDLIDEVDFKEKMIGIGVPVSSQESLEDVQAKVIEWLEADAERATVLSGALTELEDTGATILPEVLTVMASLKQVIQ
ncbi:hypothetical protein DN730_16255 [Marinomonas piezotolerans]|uniref:Uncharacterized protein n=1 Tax=Marinomonas piezotolerans TaxID=2213058 RepID=A0A370U5L1_9GAMM|nr:hypothetical protein [Marinomonas piezotolerans]RDL43052.1 hypothetical protein DN730_16255 [Marinomonas piezotolerans]